MPENTLIPLILDSVLKEAMGLNISSIGASSLKHAIGRRMRSLEMDNTFKYLNLIKKSVLELNELIEEVAVNETWFFRDEAPFDALRDYATAFVGQGKFMRLLSIPCSTGEEPYSMAITLIEAGIPAHSFSIDAVDISRRSLEVARQGIYRPNSFRSPYGKQFQQGYFTKTRQGYALDKSIKGLIRFHRGNLLHLAPPLTKTTYHVIFCRNLLIYLDVSFHQQAINTFRTLLDDNGLLFIGHAEAGILSQSSFTSAPYPKAFAFHKTAGPSERISPYQKAPPAQISTSNAKDFSLQLEPASRTASEYDPAIFPSKDRNSPEHQIKVLEAQIQKEGATSEAYFQLASIFEQTKEWQTAIGMLKKAIYLDPNSIEAIDMLAAIYQRLGDEANYQKCINRGRRIVNRLSMTAETHGHQESSAS